MYCYQNTNSFNCSDPTMGSYYNRNVGNEYWDNQEQYSPSHQISTETPYWVHEPYLNQDAEPTRIAQYPAPCQDQTHMGLSSCNIAPSVISPPVACITYSNVRIASNNNNPYQYSSGYPEPVLQTNLNVPKPYHNNITMAKKHRAQISLVSSSTGSVNAILKRKRKRTKFTTEQVAALEDIFCKKPYVTREDRQILVQRLQINDKAIKIWFQNRRLKGKRAHAEHTEPSQENEAVIDRVTPEVTQLDYVQSQIVEKTDEFGYVTLDDGVMGDLADVIDNFLTDDGGLSISNEEAKDDGSSPIYEPISPASVSDRSHDEENSTWEPSEPNDSLQRLFDLQAVLIL